MDSAVYEVDARVGQTHWWYVGRRRLFARVIADLGTKPTDPVLDVGTSAGTNLRMLRDEGFAQATGLDSSEDAIRWCAEQGLGKVHRGDITKMPFEDQSFSLVLATDVIEHVDDDVAALSEIRRVLRPGCPVLITVPAFPSLWGFQDEVSHHKRRYRMKRLLEAVRAAGLEPERKFHFNFLLFPPIWVARQVIKRLKPKIASETEVNAPFVNGVLTKLFHTDIALAPRLSPPFGVSILLVARRPA